MLQSDIRDYHHIPGPAPDIPPQPQPRFPHGLTVNLGRDLPLPRQRSSATPATSPGEFQGASTRSLRIGDIGRVHSAPPAIRRQEVYPTSPPPAYDEVLKQVPQNTKIILYNTLPTAAPPTTTHI